MDSSIGMLMKFARPLVISSILRSAGFEYLRRAYLCTKFLLHLYRDENCSCTTLSCSTSFSTPNNLTINFSNTKASSSIISVLPILAFLACIVLSSRLSECFFTSSRNSKSSFLSPSIEYRSSRLTFNILLRE